MSIQAPGELVEVLAEKMLLAAQDLFQTTAELKRRAFLANASRQLARGETRQTLAELQGRVASLECELAEAQEVNVCMVFAKKISVRQLRLCRWAEHSSEMGNWTPVQ